MAAVGVRSDKIHNEVDQPEVDYAMLPAGIDGAPNKWHQLLDDAMFFHQGPHRKHLFPPLPTNILADSQKNQATVERPIPVDDADGDADGAAADRRGLGASILLKRSWRNEVSIFGANSAHLRP